MFFCFSYVMAIFRAELLQIAGTKENIFVGSDSIDSLVKALNLCGDEAKPPVEKKNGNIHVKNM